MQTENLSMQRKGDMDNAFRIHSTTSSAISQSQSYAAANYLLIISEMAAVMPIKGTLRVCELRYEGRRMAK